MDSYIQVTISHKKNLSHAVLAQGILIKNLLLIFSGWYSSLHDYLLVLHAQEPNS